jgi:hypothetical protein
VNSGKTGKTCHQATSTKSIEETSGQLPRGQLYLQIEKNIAIERGFQISASTLFS